MTSSTSWQTINNMNAGRTTAVLRNIDIENTHTCGDRGLASESSTPHQELTHFRFIFIQICVRETGAGVVAGRKTTTAHRDSEKPLYWK